MFSVYLLFAALTQYDRPFWCIHIIVILSFLVFRLKKKKYSDDESLYKNDKISKMF